MNLSASLYAFFWLAVLQIVLGVLLATGGSVSPVIAFVHAAIGGIVLGWAFVNRRAMRATRAPARTKRTIAATFAIAAVMVVLGAILLSGAANAVGSAGVTLGDAIAVVHLVFALAIVTQAASTATGYDMWEEREFERESEPGTLGFGPPN